MRPNSPRTELKISMTSTFTNLDTDTSVSVMLSGLVLEEKKKKKNLPTLLETYRLGSAASARAALLPLIPTETPHIRLHVPTVKPAQNKA